MSKLDIMRIWKKAEESQPHRTSIEELSAIGYELSKEDLQFVSGGLARENDLRADCTDCTNCCDDCLSSYHGCSGE
jgi:hypothetical protein